MNKLEKKQYVKNLESVLSSSAMVVLFHNYGLNVSSFRELRRNLKNIKSKCVVAKNSLVKIAIKDSSYFCVSNKLVGPVVVVFSESNVTETAKVISDFCKQNDKARILGASINAKYLSDTEVESLASLPTLDVLQSQLVGLLKKPAERIACILKEPARMLARVISEYSKK